MPRYNRNRAYAVGVFLRVRVNPKIMSEKDGLKRLRPSKDSIVRVFQTASPPGTHQKMTIMRLQAALSYFSDSL